jgi:hypothetical protein
MTLCYASEKISKQQSLQGDLGISQTEKGSEWPNERAVTSGTIILAYI